MFGTPMRAKARDFCVINVSRFAIRSADDTAVERIESPTSDSRFRFVRSFRRVADEEPLVDTFPDRRSRRTA